MHKSFLLTLLALVAICSAGRAQDFDTAIFDEYELPNISRKMAPHVANHLNAVCRKLRTTSVKAQTINEGLIAQVVIPASELFAPNDTLLRSSAPTLLTPIVNLMKAPGHYRLLVAVHSDDTGSPEYLLDLTDSRAQAIQALFLRHGISEDAIELYPMGDEENLLPNNNRTNRASNRRVEFYLVPDQGLLKSLKK